MVVRRDGPAVTAVRRVAVMLAAMLAILLVMLAQAAAAAPKVVVSIKPLHSLVAAVMEGVGSPTLLLPGAASPHGHSLRPSGARALAGADIVFWLGPELEAFLERPLAALAGRERVVGLGALPELTHPPDRLADAHVWLSTANAGAIAAAAARVLAARDPENAASYAANGADLAVRLQALDAELHALLAPVALRPFVVFHDAYRYFVAAYGLNEVAAVAVDPERRPGARRLIEVRARIAATGARCVFTEPQLSPALAATVVEGTGARLAHLDPLGADLKPGAALYFTLMRRLGTALADCLGDAPLAPRRAP